MQLKPSIIFLFMLSVAACQPKPETTDNEPQAAPESSAYAEGSFGDDLSFLHQYHDNLIVLKSSDEATQVAVAPNYQGRVMTSTAGGLSGKSFGWMNRELIASGKFQEHFNAFGGEDRFWLGPEGGQFSIFFAEGTDFTFENWYTPAPIDTDPFEVADSASNKVSFTKDINIKNYSGTAFNLKVNRTIALLDSQQVAESLGIQLPDSVHQVAFSSENIISNTGKETWTKEKGLLSIWILGMFQPSANTTVVIPFKLGISNTSVPILNDTYFGKVPEDRLIVADSIIYFKGDGTYRSKIGVPPQRAKPVMGSYDANNKILTIVHCTLPQNNYDYVNSMWEIQDQPYGGDAINAYNDGPLEEGGQLGPFYELESSSPAAALAPEESMAHVQTTFHFTGSEAGLNAIAEKVLGVGIEKISTIFMP